jgi:hypothetical protein
MEELLRTALREDNARIGPADVRPLKLDAVPYSRRDSMRYLAHWRPAFAAAAVLVIVALSLTLSQVLPGGRPRHAASAHPSARPSATARQSGIPTGTTAPPETVPAYYAAVTAARSPAYRGPQNVTIRDTYTAAVLATVMPPAGYGTFAFVTGTGRAGRYIAGAQPWHPAGLDNSAPPVKLFLLSYDAGSRRAALRPLPSPPMRASAAAVLVGQPNAGTWLAADALSADGSKLAIVVATPAGVDVRVYTLASGAVRKWAAPALSSPITNWDFSLAWLHDNRTLAIGADFGFGDRDAPVWFLDTSAPGGELAAASRTVTLTFPKAKPSTSFAGPHTPARCELPIATSDGRTLLCSGTADFPLNNAGATAVGIWVFSARTGKLTGILEQRTICCALMGTQFPRIVWASSTGDTIVVTGIMDVDGGTPLFVLAPVRQLRQIPWPGGIIHYPGIGNPYEPDVAW